ncbi:hypothetical protein BUALT_Bualt07G0118600 [Buddleja alternifolia]|uniref:Uncharacterized protein n=1 Tax=Buddleja alternifolia TaxID=168488 RepID=A0AAV6XBC2_9LAMI|nr:hypothetical protein BUALT_Bualt07G0118600 [Buddleja alternifolia]
MRLYGISIFDFLCEYAGVQMKRSQEKNHTNSQTKSSRNWAWSSHPLSSVCMIQSKAFKKKATFQAQPRMTSPFISSLSPSNNKAINMGGLHIA